MTATLGTAAVSRALVRVPRWGAWVAEVEISDATALALGSRQTLALGSLSLVGAIVDGGPFGGHASYTVVGGAGAWGTKIPAQPYHDDAGILLSAVLRDLVAATGEVGGALEAPDRPLGRDWTRPAGRARDQLDALTSPRGQWWVAADGTTHLGPRPTSSLTAPPTLSVASFDPATLRAVVQLADDSVGALVPGVTLTAPGLPAPLPIAAVTVRVEPGTIEAELWGESPISELLARIVDARTAWRTFMPPTPYTVQTVASDGRVAVQPADERAAGLPGDPLVGHAPGIPGASYTLAPSTAVLLAWVGGDPGSPVIVAYPASSLPVSVVLDASSSVSLGAGGAPLALATPLSAWISSLISTLASHGITAPAAPTIATTKAKGV